MAKKPSRNLIVGLDIGTSKISTLVGEIGTDGQIEVVGVGSHPSRGLKRGVVVNIDATVQSIQRAVEEAELMAGCQIRSAYTGIAGSHIRSLNSHGIVAIQNQEVGQADVDRVIDAARAVAIPASAKNFCAPALVIKFSSVQVRPERNMRAPRISPCGVKLENFIFVLVS